MSSVPKTPKVFISYSHDSFDHKEFVRALAERLRGDGVDCVLDQYINGFPPEGWIKWMERQIEQADYVLLVCTEPYLERYRGFATEGGRGVTFEGVVISQTLYDAFQRNDKFIPIIPSHGRVEHVPIPLKQYSTYRLPEDYETLYRLLTQQAAFIPNLGVIRPAQPVSLWKRFFTKSTSLPTHLNALAGLEIYELRFPVTDNNAIIGRDDMLARLNQYWEQPSVRIVVLHAFGGVGKTALVNLWREQLRLGQGALHPPARIYAWSFQNQGSHRQHTSSQAFFDHALKWFGAEQTRFGSEQAKGEYLAQLIQRERNLLILDGLEVFQTWQHVDELKNRIADQALYALLKTLAQTHIGLCVITSRQRLDPRLEHSGIVHQALDNLSTEAAIQLLQQQGVKGKSEQLKPIAQQYHCHAYSLALVASYLKTHAKGDYRRLDTLPPLLQDDVEVNWQGRRIMVAYAKELSGTPELGLLYLVSVFDQGVEAELIRELLRALMQGYQSAVRQLGVERLYEAASWAKCVGRLREQGLMLGSDEYLDLHPLVREFFRAQFQEKLGGIKKRVHRELYAYFKALPEKELPDTLEEMQPLFAAVAQGCAAGLHQQVLNEVYSMRIRREGEAYIAHRLGAFSDDLAVVAHFFTIPWSEPAADLSEHYKAFVLSCAGFSLRALGRLREAVEPMQAGMKLQAGNKDWKNAAMAAGNISELQLTLGDIHAAIESARSSVDYAEQSGGVFERMSDRTTLADALHQAGEAASVQEALDLFQAAEQIQRERQAEYPRLYSLQGFQYCDWLLAQGQVAEVVERAEYALAIAKDNRWLLDIALAQLTLGKALSQESYLNQAVDGLRASGYQEFLALGLLARAQYYRHAQNYSKAHTDLQAVYDIAEPSGMRLHLTDYHLKMARLLWAELDAREVELPPSPALPPQGGQGACLAPSPTSGEGWDGGLNLIIEHITAAEALINATGYHRRDPELADLKAQLKPLSP